jgi:hypothetical protein
MTKSVDTGDGRVEADDGPIGPPPLSARPVILLFKCSQSRSRLHFFPIPTDSGAMILPFRRLHSTTGRVGQAHRDPWKSTSPARSSSKACRTEGRESWRASRGSWRQANRPKQPAAGLKGCEMKMARGQSPPLLFRLPPTDRRDRLLSKANAAKLQGVRSTSTRRTTLAVADDGAARGRGTERIQVGPSFRPLFVRWNHPA